MVILRSQVNSMFDVRSMKNPRLTVFAGAITSLAFMHVMASFFGYATTIIPRGRIQVINKGC